MKKSKTTNIMNIMASIPKVQRARNYRLYTEGGKRLIDLWLNGGAAVLGHTPPNLLRELKNTASRGLYAPFPHFTEKRFLKALSKLFPECSFCYYAAPPIELLSKISHSSAAKNESRGVKFWRPYTNPEEPFAADNTQSLFIPILPGIQTWRDGLPFGLCIVAAKLEENLTKLPPSDALSPILLALAARGIHDILASPQRAKLNLPRINKALKTGTSKWKKQGIYLTLKEETTTEEWETLFNKFLEAGFLLPPTQAHPLILPAEMSDGEEAKLVAVLIG
ncbi:MAG: hypothetical protein FWD28_01470 [Treponema sp.]|nr:hypothetical protein [Treponema sp.]